MSRKFLAPILVLAALVFAACERNANQTAGNAAAGNSSSSNAAAAALPGGISGGNSAQAASDLFSSFPESQAVIFMNGDRIQQAIRAVAPQKYDQMFNDAQREMGFDIRRVRTVGLGIRVREPISPNTPPDFIVILKGDVTAEMIATEMAKNARGGRRQETYNGKTIEILTMRAAPSTTGNSSYTPPPSSDPFPEAAIASISADTVAIGVPNYVKSAIDAAGGSAPRLRQDLVDAVSRNSDALMSIAGNIPPSLSDMIRSQGVLRSNPEAERLVLAMRGVQAFVNMTGSDFVIQLNGTMDTADNATYLSGLVARMKSELETQINSAPPSSNPNAEADKQAALSILRSITNTASGNEVRLSVTVPQSLVQQMVQREMR